MTTLTIIGPQFSTFVRTIELICRYKNIPYKITMEHESKVIEFRDEQHLKLHPFTKVPVLIDGEFVLPESHAIASYLNDKYDLGLFPINPEEKAQVIAWSSMISQYVYQHLISQYILELKFPKGEDGEVRIDVINQNRSLAQNTLQKLESQVNDQGYFIGNDFSLCDALLLPILTYVYAIPEPFTVHQNTPKLAKYLDRMCVFDFTQGVLTLPKD